MSGSRGLLPWLPAMALGALWLFAIGANRPGHLADSQCGSCHLGDRNVTPADAAKLVASQEVLCGRCHANALQMSHPSGLIPGRPLPAGYPLDWKGDLTCSTCHEPHGTRAGLLRGDKRGKDICLSCHDEAFFALMKDSGVSITSSGHLNATRLELHAMDLDPYSLECMDCHSGSGDLPQVAIDRRAILRHGSGSVNHPIGRRYREAAKSGGYRPERLLSKKVWLPDGKISCVSCHQGYSKDHGKLVLPKGRSTLCFECHDL